ncbi:MAG: glutamate 5-kinase [Actinobacteria bacterium]|nr:glutamate 5-kinase [Actinomycetota bacterium]
MARDIGAAKRVVVKVGSSSLVTPKGGVSRARLAGLVEQVAGVARSRACVLVSSGAIAAGLGPLGAKRRPSDIPGLQAAAAVGQGRLMAAYTEELSRRRLVAAQVLLTQDDFIHRRQFVNAKNTFDRLLAAGAVPVVNENDTVATEEIRFGDNDRLAALVAVMIGADLLILLSDVEGIYDTDPRKGKARLLREVGDPSTVRATGPHRGSGGMASKLEAATIATSAGIAVIVAKAGRAATLQRILDGEAVGTHLPAAPRKHRARKAWIAFVREVRGRITVDAGAERALREDGRSLLAAGIKGVDGTFEAGDAVEIAASDGRAFARGIVNYGSGELPKIAGRTRAEIAGLPGGPYDREVVHRDELVVIAP